MNTLIFILSSSGKQKGWMKVKGYNTSDGYMGLVNGEYRLFSCEADYLEWLED